MTKLDQLLLHLMKQLLHTMLAYSDIDGRLTNDDDIESLHEVDINENNCSSDVVSSDVVSCYGVKWKVVEGVLEDWRCAPQYGAHIAGNDADELQRTPIDYWKLSFPYSCCLI